MFVTNTIPKKRLESINLDRKYKISILLNCEYLVLFRTVANYLMWRVVKSKFIQLSSDFIELFKFYYLQAFNYWSDSDQHQLCLLTTSQKFGIALSKVFLDQKFYGDSKKLVRKNTNKLYNLLKYFRFCMY